MNETGHKHHPEQSTGNQSFDISYSDAEKALYIGAIGVELSFLRLGQLLPVVVQ